MGVFWVLGANLGHLAMDMYQNRYFAMFYQCSYFQKSNFVVETVLGVAAPINLGNFRVLGANLNYLAMDMYQNRYFAMFYQCSHFQKSDFVVETVLGACLLYTSPSPRDGLLSRMPSSA